MFREVDGVASSEGTHYITKSLVSHRGRSLYVLTLRLLGHGHGFTDIIWVPLYRQKKERRYFIRNFVMFFLENIRGWLNHSD
jgi:hypothetical protein